jgi:small subunit ribosomal protein S4
MYGVLEKQFRGYYEEANRKSGKTGEVLLQILESRLDNVVYRAGFAPSRDAARQLVRHGHMLVNGKKVDIPSYAMRQGDTIAVRPGSVENATIAHAREEVKGRGVPQWLELDGTGLVGKIAQLPTREQINLPVQEQLIVELYSK